MTETKFQVCKCDIRDADLRKSKRNILELASLPPEAIEKSIDELNWVMKCDCDDPYKIISAVHYVNNDWYLCTVKNLITRPEFRRKGLATSLLGELLEKMDNDDRCLVYGADIDYDNETSKNRFIERGFKTINQFCWEKGQKPADILHYVKFKPTNNKC